MNYRLFFSETPKLEHWQCFTDFTAELETGLLCIAQHIYASELICKERTSEHRQFNVFSFPFAPHTTPISRRRCALLRV